MNKLWDICPFQNVLTFLYRKATLQPHDCNVDGHWWLYDYHSYPNERSHCKHCGKVITKEGLKNEQNRVSCSV